MNLSHAEDVAQNTGLLMVLDGLLPRNWPRRMKCLHVYGKQGRNRNGQAQGVDIALCMLLYASSVPAN